MRQLQAACPATVILLAASAAMAAAHFAEAEDVTVTPTSTPTPIPWPEQFHALLFTNVSGKLQIANMWYDWKRGRNVYVRQMQLGELLYDVEWSNGTSFYFTMGTNASCKTIFFGVGLPRPDFLVGANYLGTRLADGFLCNVWEKVGFVWYYEDVLSKRPVKWDFSDGISTHVFTFEAGAVLQDSVSQAPAYCFGQDSKVTRAYY